MTSHSAQRAVRGAGELPHQVAQLADHPPICVVHANESGEGFHEGMVTSPVSLSVIEWGR